ncbi:hypothetical protein KR032_010949, partial [Drosophila birchii]
AESPSSEIEMAITRRCTEYNMQHNKRGRALIFNHNHFVQQRSRPRTQMDSMNLKQVLQQLGFHVDVYQDFYYKQIQSTINEAAAQDHGECDCILVAMLTHGENGYLYAKDTEYQIENILNPFSSSNCPSLASKPKLFFIQACQGNDGRIEETTLRSHLAETDSDSWSPCIYRAPVYADFLIVYSAIPGFSSWRNTRKGSWFIHNLCAELAKNGKQLDFITLLTFVCQRVPSGFESYTPDNPERLGMKQIPCIVNMLNRTLRFNDK